VGAANREHRIRAMHLVAITLALFAIRLILTLPRTGPVLVADEIGYLTNARVLAGGTAGQLQLAPFYHGGYSLLLAPLLSLTSEPDTAYRLVLAANAALAAAVFPLLYLLLTRCGGMSSRMAVGPALAGAFYPAITVLSQVSMSENALFPLTCVWLIALCQTARARDLQSGAIWAAAASASAAACWAVHGRMITAVILTVALIGWLALRHRLSVQGAVVALSVLGSGLVATHALDSFLVARNYGGHVANETDVRLSALLHPRAILFAGENVLGQAWYIVVATFGLAAVTCASAMRGIGRRPTAAEDQILVPARGVTALTGLLLLVSAASFPVRTRPDMLIYGRYVEVAAPPLVALGLALLARAGTLWGTRAAFAAFGAATATVILFRATSRIPQDVNRWNVSSLPFVTAHLGPAILLGAALVATAGAWLLRHVAQRRPAASWVLVLCLSLPIVGYGSWNPVLKAQRSTYPAGWSSPGLVADALHIRVLGYDRDHYVGGLYTVQWFLPSTSVVLFHAGREQPPSQYVLASHAWPLQHPTPRGVAIWTNAGHDEVIWRLGD
jgi:hypothetical protein